MCVCVNGECVVVMDSNKKNVFTRDEYLHFDVASNFSLFFFLRHFHGLKKRPRALNLLLRSSGGDRVPDPKLFARIAAPLCCFLAVRGSE